MSFTECFESELQRLTPLFTAAERADREFHKAWKEGCRELGCFAYKQTDRYGCTLDRFHLATQGIDGVVSAAFIQAKLGDETQTPTLFAYIALPGRYFRSGYRRADIWRYLKKCLADEEQIGILRKIVLHQIEKAGPEFWEICRTIVKLDSASFREELNSLRVQSKKEYVRQRVDRVLERLQSSSR